MYIRVIFKVIHQSKRCLLSVLFCAHFFVNVGSEENHKGRTRAKALLGSG